MSYHYITSPRRVPCMGMHVSVGCAIGAWTKEKRRSHTGLYAVVRRIASPRSVVVVMDATSLHHSGADRSSRRNRQEELEEQT